MALAEFPLILLVTVVFSYPPLLHAMSAKFPSKDSSPYCKDLSKSDNICKDFTGIFLCPQTCRTAGVETIDCGERFTKAAFKSKGILKRNKRIVGGKTSSEGAWPWLVALVLKGKQYCGGVVLTPDWILTAAHCFGSYSSTNKEDWEVVLGEHHLGDREVFEQRRKIKKYIIHQRNYRFWRDGYQVPDIYDLALIKLDRPATLTKWVRPACLPPNDWSFRDDHNCKVAGWGHMSYQGKQPSVPREATVMLIPRRICNLPISYNGTIHKSSLCAGFKQGGVDACQYDSGGPLNCPHQNRWYLQGVVSWGFRCALPNKYGVYASVPYMKQWILNTILSYNPQTNTFSGRLATLLEKANMKYKRTFYYDPKINK